MGIALYRVRLHFTMVNTGIFSFFFSTYLFAYSSSEVISYIRARIIYREIVRILPVFTAFLRFFFVGGVSSFYVFIMMLLFIPHLFPYLFPIKIFEILFFSSLKFSGCILLLIHKNAYYD